MLIFDWSCCLVDYEDELCSRFFWELVKWPKEVTLVTRTQPSGPLCLWQCFNIYTGYLERNEAYNRPVAQTDEEVLILTLRTVTKQKLLLCQKYHICILTLTWKIKYHIMKKRCCSNSWQSSYNLWSTPWQRGEEALVRMKSKGSHQKERIFYGQAEREGLPPPPPPYSQHMDGGCQSCTWIWITFLV